jgi:hypothetical protein
MPEAKATKLSI